MCLYVSVYVSLRLCVSASLRACVCLIHSFLFCCCRILCDVCHTNPWAGSETGENGFYMVGSQRACKRCFAAVEALPHRELFYPFPAAPTPAPAPEAEEVHEVKAPQLDDVKDFLAGKGMEYSSEITAKLHVASRNGCQHRREMR